MPVFLSAQLTTCPSREPLPSPCFSEHSVICELRPCGALSFLQLFHCFPTALSAKELNKSLKYRRSKFESQILATYVSFSICVPQFPGAHITLQYPCLPHSACRVRVSLPTENRGHNAQPCLVSVIRTPASSTSCLGVLDIRETGQLPYWQTQERKLHGETGRSWGGLSHLITEAPKQPSP